MAYGHVGPEPNREGVQTVSAKSSKGIDVTAKRFEERVFENFIGLCAAVWHI